MKGRSRRLIQLIILGAILIIGGIAIGQTFADDSGTLPKVGKEPPYFELSDLNRNVYRQTDFTGQPYIINFWGTFCPPCVKEMPEFQRQYEKWGDKGLKIVAINLSEDDLTIRNFLRSFELEYNILKDINRTVERRFGVRAYPTTYFVKADGTIMEIVQGGMTEDQINRRVEKLFDSK
ncbi:redoxin domain-containing protein [Paenibacillus agaridevorans]|uniref:redoxin domain-containing protein n=1 Tax=Paenibacillus agaridevorans TaxID=171404 RepID=UPI001BE3CF91|nr:redoxin domain-containing protein [Paenibacillus agaridevorans]